MSNSYQLNIIGKRKIWYIFTVVLFVIGIAGYAFGGVNLGIDFTGGSILELSSQKHIQVSDVENVYKDINIELNRVTPDGSGGVIIRSKPVDQEKKAEIIKKLNSSVDGNIEEKKFETIGPTVSADLFKKSILSIIGASVAIILYLAYSFRKATRIPSWRFGLLAIVTLLHDVIVTSGIYIFVSRFTGYEIDTLFVSALLTVMSFSVHDTIVVFDRIREHLSQNATGSLEIVVNESIITTLARSLNTSLTIIIVLLTLFVLGGHSTSGFVLTLLIGMAIGTYSSIFIASPMLVSWEDFVNRKIGRK